MKKLFLTLALVGWFYASKAPLQSYPGASTLSIDGPFRTEEDCKVMREDWLDTLKMLGVKDVKVAPCFEKKEA
jgi:hypothetical protein